MGAERVAVTGIGMVCALGRGAREGFARLVTGERGIGPLSSFEAPWARARIAAEAPMAEERGQPPGTPRTDALALVAAREALASAGLDARSTPLALAVGGTTGGMLDSEIAFRDAPGDMGPAERAGRLLLHPLSTTVRALERDLGAFRASATLCSACSSGAMAVIEGARWIAEGEVAAALVGGADALCRMTFAGFDALGVMSPEPCRPFDVARRGLTLGEGAAFLVLESESHALARGARPLGWLVGFAAGAEAHHVTQPEPGGTRAIELMTEALCRAGLEPSAVDYVNAHGTGTPANDAMEASALLALFGAHRPLVSSSKGQIGHTLGAAGALEAAIAVMALEGGVAPPSGGLERPEVPELRHVIGRGMAANLRVALSNSFGFGGMDAVLVFERAGTERRPATMASATASGPSEVVVSAIAVLDGGGRVLSDAREILAADLEPGAGGGDPLDLLEPARSRRFDRATAWLALGSERALAAAGEPSGRVGLVAGSAYGPVQRSARFLERILGPGPQTRGVPPAEFPYLVQSAAAGCVSLYLGLRGPVVSVADGALGGEAAFSRALGWLELGLCEAVVAGAVEAADPAVATLGPHVLGDRSLARGEGGGLLVLEMASAARKRGHRPLARLVVHVERSAEGRCREHAEERAPGRLSAVLARAPREPERAELVLAPSDMALLDVLEGSPWASVRRRFVPASTRYHEALGGTALAIGAALAAGGASAVLVLAGDGKARFVTWFEPARVAP